MKVAPRPFLLSTEMVPPAFSTMFFVIESPSPVPEAVKLLAFCARKNSRNILGSSDSGIPMPVSATVSIATGGSSFQLTRTSPSGGV